MKLIGGAALLAAAFMISACGSGSGDSSDQTKLQTAYSYCKKQEVDSAIEGIDLDSDGKGMSLTTGKKNSPNEHAQLVGLACVLAKLKTPQSIIDRVDRTTALMGEVDASRDGLDYAWSYHPDNGLNMTIEESGS